MKIQKFMKLKPYVPPVMAILSLLVLVGLVTAATLDRAGGSLAGGDDPVGRWVADRLAGDQPPPRG